MTQRDVEKIKYGTFSSKLKIIYSAINKYYFYQNFKIDDNIKTHNL